MWSPDWTRLRFRDIAIADGYTVCRWRNSASARDSFFSRGTVTPDTHAAFVISRKPHDLVWIVEEKATGDAVGMLSLTVSVASATAEYGRAFLDERYRRRGYWVEIEWMLLHFAFDVLALRSVWLDIYADNEAMCAIHRRFGWVEDPGRRREVNGRSVVCMSLTAEQWDAMREEKRQVVAQRIQDEARG